MRLWRHRVVRKSTVHEELRVRLPSLAPILKLNQVNIVKFNLLNEMAYERKDAILKCDELGNNFIEHFHKIMSEGKDSTDFIHHCIEMDAWWNKVKNIVIKSTKKKISKSQLKDWFFEVGSSVEYIIQEEYQETYNELIFALLNDYSMSVKDILVNII